MGEDREKNSYVYEFDELNRMEKVYRGDGKWAEYSYDGTSARVGKTVGTAASTETETTKYYNLGATVLNEVSSEEGNTTNLIGAGIEARLNVSGSSITSAYFLQKNAHGDVTAAISGTERVATYDYDAFGNTLVEEGEINNPIRYSGEYLDEESGLIYLRARYYDPSVGRFISEDPIRDGMNWYAYCGNSPVNFYDCNGMWMEGDEKLSQGAQIYTQHYGEKWEEANQRYQEAIATGDISGAETARLEMHEWNAKANDIRYLDSQGLVSGTTLPVPMYNQYNISGGNGTNLCWAACVAMWISYLLGDTVDRTLDVGIAVANDMVSQGVERLNADGSLNYNVPRAWQSTDYVAGLLGLSGVTASQTQTYGNLSMADIQATIDGGSPFGVLYRSATSGHWVLGVGYATAPGHDPLVVSNDPAGGIQQIQTYNEFQTLPDGRIWTWTVQ